jgi:hypothetical protein
VRATERWERYRNDGTPVQTWRSEWRGEWQGQTMAMLSHSVVSPDGLERLKLRLLPEGEQGRHLTLTTMPDSVLLNLDGELSEVALPPGYGLFVPLPSLARFAFPFDLASDERELGMVLFARIRGHGGELHLRPAKFAYLPLGFETFMVKGQEIRAKGWSMDVPGIPLQRAWFDRNGTCLAWQVGDTSHPLTAHLTDWMTFG